jgi:ribonuclease HII
MEIGLLPFFKQEHVEAGIDEAGRGCYAGPVFAAAVILPTDFYHPLLNDSKKLDEDQRYLLRPIIEQQAIAYGVAAVDNDTIDHINILQATYQAMHAAVEQLKVSPNFLLIDGNRFRPHRIPHQCFVKGDGTYASIAAASILAKTYRDDHMKMLHDEFPHYAWHRNKGYGTATHRNAIAEHGLCKHHRRSFNILPQQIEMEFEANSL